MPDLLFHGAAEEVTGSMHMVRVDGRWVALDCGLFQGRRAESEAKNREWPVPPARIAAVVLSHAHIDHSGRLPRLVRDGFEGPIFCTPATRDLCAIMLPDSAHIQEEDSVFLNKRRRKHGLPPVEPLYDYEHALGAINLMQTVGYGRLFPVVPGLLACFREAGHMLGSAGIRLEFGKRNGNTASLYYTGDIGGFDKPIIRDPSPIPADDTILCESTYGGRVNESVDTAQERMGEIVRRTIERGGKVITPSFAVGRTQTLVYYLHQQFIAGTLPRVPVYVDSPLAVHATEVFRLHPDCYDAEARVFNKVTGDILGNGCCTYIRSVDESKALNVRKEPCVIIASSGMCEAGRIRHHLANNLDNPRNTILLPGYQAANTLGRKLAEGAERVTLFHEEIPVRAEIAHLHGFSGHADRNELLRLLTPRAKDARRVILVHGEPEQAQAFAEALHELGFASVLIGRRGMQIEL